MRRSSRPAERGSFKPKRDAKSTGRPARRFDTLSLLSLRLLARIERARVAAIPTPLLQLTIERARVASSHHPVRVPAVSLPAPTWARIERARVASPLRFLRQLETGTPARSRSRPHPCYASLRRPPLQSGAMYASPPLPILLSTPSPSRCVVTVRRSAIGGRASNGFCYLYNTRRRLSRRLVHAGAGTQARGSSGERAVAWVGRVKYWGLLMLRSTQGGEVPCWYHCRLRDRRSKRRRRRKGGDDSTRGALDASTQ